LALVDAVAHLETLPEELQARVGIATGLVVVGDLLGSGEAQELGVVGDTPNLAARLQTWADPGSVLIGSATRRLVGGLFEYADFGMRQLKGFSRPVQIWKVLGETEIEARFDAFRSRESPIIGRDEELTVLQGCWERARSGNGQVVSICAGPGLGKTRLVAALQERVAGASPVRLSYFASAHHRRSPLHPIIAQMRRAAGFLPEDGIVEKRAKLAHLIAVASPPPEHAAALFHLLGLPPAERDPLRDLSPQRRKELTFDALLRQLDAIAAHAPVLILFDDAHWLDASSRELLDLAIQRVRSLPALLLITYRPDSAEDCATRPHMTTLLLSPLNQDESRSVVRRIAGDKPLPPEVVGQILDHADGVPLFLEELTKAVLESEMVAEEADKYVLNGPLPAPVVPATLQEWLLARLDRLAHVRDVAQVGAVIGREFDHEILADVADLPEDELRHAVTQLIEAEIVFRSGAGPGRYIFKHALIQEAAYSTLLKGRRQGLHARIAEALARKHPDVVEREPEVLARHFACAGASEKAVDLYLRAAKQALSRSAVADTIALLKQGLREVAFVVDKGVRRRQEVDLQLLLSRALAAAKGFSAPEIGGALRRARKLVERLADVDRMHATLSQQWGYQLVRGEIRAAEETARALLHSAEEHNEVAGQKCGHLAVGVTLLALGSPAQAAHSLERALQLADLPDSAAHFLVGLADRVMARAYLSLALVQTGRLDRGRTLAREAVAIARDLRDGLTTAFALALASMCHLWSGNDGELEACGASLVDVAREQGLPFYQAVGCMLQGLQLARAGNPAGEEILRQSLGFLQSTGQLYQPAYATSLYAEACEALGLPEVGLEQIEKTLALMQDTGERDSEPELQRWKGRLHAAVGEVEQATACFSGALASAQWQGAKLWETRVAADLGRLWFGAGNEPRERGFLALEGRISQRA
jgi:tetratricopeptide (TPR) repeat protein